MNPILNNGVNINAEMLLIIIKHLTIETVEFTGYY